MMMMMVVMCAEGISFAAGYTLQADNREKK